MPLPAGAVGNELEIRVNFTSQVGHVGHVGLQVLSTPDNREGVNISFGELVRHPGLGLLYSSQSLDGLSGGKTVVEAPLVINNTISAVHSLRVFVDHAVVEAQLDGATAIMNGFFPLSPKEAVVVRVYAGVDSDINISSVEVWGMGSTWV